MPDRVIETHLRLGRGFLFRLLLGQQGRLPLRILGDGQHPRFTLHGGAGRWWRGRTLHDWFVIVVVARGHAGQQGITTPWRTLFLAVFLVILLVLLALVFFLAVLFVFLVLVFFVLPFQFAVRRRVAPTARPAVVIVVVVAAVATPPPRLLTFCGIVKPRALR
jgi:hypothetical protein